MLRDRKRFQTFNLTFWFYFIIILIINNVEMTGDFLAPFLVQKFHFLKKKKELGLVTIKHLKKLPFWDEYNLT